MTTHRQSQAARLALAEQDIYTASRVLALARLRVQDVAPGLADTVTQAHARTEEAWRALTVALAALDEEGS